MKKKIVIAGGTGFIGRYLKEHFTQSGYDVVVISRGQPHVQWHDEASIINALENAEMVVNLAGKSVDCRYTEKNKKEILRSRTATTKAIGNAILKCSNPPELWLNSSTATIYRHAEDKPMTERKGEVGSGFSVDVATKWEEAFFSFPLSHTRLIALRIAIVLGKDGGVMKPLKNLVRAGLGGKQGKGNQMFSWIHIEDLLRIILFLQTHKELNGVFNCSSPHPVTNSVLMKSLRQAMKVSIGVPSPSWLLKLGAFIINTEPELVLKSRWVVPERLVEAGYDFIYPTIEKALTAIMSKSAP